MTERIPCLAGLLETSLYVEDLERSKRFYRTLFQFQILGEDDRLCALSVAGRQILLLFEKESARQPAVLPGGTIPGHGGSGSLHLAFAISASDWNAWESRLREENVAIESTVDWPRGGRSLYFRDPDNHLIELATPGIWAIY
jgi:catechol 2,3-dioxygenase-like lactoylglutathione lyase family enzyme